MEWSDVGKAVAKVAPILGGVLGGPVGAITGAAGALLGSALGVDADPESITKALADPETLVKLKQIESDERQRLLEWQSTQLNAELENVKSAREREVALAQAGHGASWATSIVSCIVTVGFFVMLYLVISGGKSELGDAGLMLLGTLATGFGAVINYYLGSSLGSASKDKLFAAKDAGGK
ncbi:hypothetical protein [uncultured Desulfovibrio sp.]|jgi:hypothetical protein|uniref:hypothetical protein n=1 Tax=uncultured Desulfovibrio sp. TaxID=167968 RepID=UPI002805A5B1|nr:hypothetical protein [uncultured Desulfovibrio sp.]